MDELAWEDLLNHVRNGNVLPIVGPLLSTVPDGRPLTQWLAPLLAKALDCQLNAPDGDLTLNSVVSQALFAGQRRDRIYSAIRTVLRDTTFPASPSLLNLAGIRDFNVYLTTAFDSYLAHALEQERQLDPATGVLAFHPKRPVDLPKHSERPVVYHILGYLKSYPDFAVWDEDFLEFILSLQRHRDQLPTLFDLLRERHLLICGVGFSDWMVRFFLHVARQKRLSDSKDGVEYLVDLPGNLPSSLTIFFNRVNQQTQVIPGQPAEFVRELRERWERVAGEIQGAQELLSLPTTPQGTIFISYAREDADRVQRLADQLISAGLSVWLDKRRLEAGMNFEREFRQVVSEQCHFFISIVSRNTESRREGYFHKERHWAVERLESFAPGEEFYIPVIIDPEVHPPRREPAEVSKLQWATLPGGKADLAFIQRLQKLVERQRRH